MTRCLGLRPASQAGPFLSTAYDLRIEERGGGGGGERREGERGGLRGERERERDYHQFSGIILINVHVHYRCQKSLSNTDAHLHNMVHPVVVSLSNVDSYGLERKPVALLTPLDDNRAGDH